MTAYAIFIRNKTTDPAELESYGKLSVATGEGHELTPRVANATPVVLEGDEAEAITMLEFPTVEAARAWYDSPAYKQAREHRFKGAQYTVLIAEGL